MKVAVISDMSCVDATTQVRLAPINNGWSVISREVEEGGDYILNKSKTGAYSSLMEELITSISKVYWVVLGPSWSSVCPVLSTPVVCALEPSESPVFCSAHPLEVSL